MPMDELHEELDACVLPSVLPLLREPPGTANSQMCAGREGDDHIPVGVKHLEDIALEMEVLVFTFRRQEVAGPSVMSPSDEGVANSPAVFAGYKYVHDLVLSF